MPQDKYIKGGLRAAASFIPGVGDAENFVDVRGNLEQIRKAYGEEEYVKLLARLGLLGYQAASFYPAVKGAKKMVGYGHDMYRTAKHGAKIFLGKTPPRYRGPDLSNIKEIKKKVEGIRGRERDLRHKEIIRKVRGDPYDPKLNADQTTAAWEAEELLDFMNKSPKRRNRRTEEILRDMERME
jgi:hypothetical protein